MNIKNGAQWNQRFILDKVENGDLVAHWGEQRVPVGSEEKIPFAIDGPQ
jgi:hypothetical protein